jgi:hypothetical protein
VQAASASECIRTDVVLEEDDGGAVVAGALAEANEALLDVLAAAAGGPVEVHHHQRARGLGPLQVALELLLRLELRHAVHRAELLLLLDRGQARPPGREPFVLPAAASSSSLLLSVAEAAKRRRRQLRVILGKGSGVAVVGQEREAALEGRTKRERRGRTEEAIMAAF